jgi:site-specific recombinase XerD
MLGHKSINITQTYAKILDRKVSEDMGLLKEKFAARDQIEKLRAAQ